MRFKNEINYMGQWDFCEREGEEKKTEGSKQKRKYAQLTTDLRNAVANKKIIWAEEQLRTLINRAGFN